MTHKYLATTDQQRSDLRALLDAFARGTLVQGPNVQKHGNGYVVSPDGKRESGQRTHQLPFAVFAIESSAADGNRYIYTAKLQVKPTTAYDGFDDAKVSNADYTLYSIAEVMVDPPKAIPSGRQVVAVRVPTNSDAGGEWWIVGEGDGFCMVTDGSTEASRLKHGVLEFTDSSGLSGDEYNVEFDVDNNGGEPGNVLVTAKVTVPAGAGDQVGVYQVTDGTTTATRSDNGVVEFDTGTVGAGETAVEFDVDDNGGSPNNIKVTGKITNPNAENPTGTTDLGPATPETTETAQSDTWTAGTANGVTIKMLTRVVYDHASDAILYGYYRTFTYDQHGMLYSISAETRYTIDDPDEGCAT